MAYVFDDGTFVRRGFVSYGSLAKDVFCKIGDIRVYSFPHPVAHRVVGYDLLYWDGLQKPTELTLSDYEAYKSPTTGVSRLAFNAKPFKFKDEYEVLGHIRVHFVNTEMKGLRNRSEAESFSLSNYKNNQKEVLELEGYVFEFSNMVHIEEYTVDENLVHQLTRNEIECKLVQYSNGMTLRDATLTIQANFESRLAIPKTIVDYVTENISDFMI